MLGIFDWIGDFFKSLFDLIPKVMYLLYASLACVLDVFQLLFRKLAGLDVYYIDGQQQTGDIVLGFITGILGIRSDGFEYSVLSTVFWAFMIFGIIICFVSTVIAIVKSHYSYDDKSAKGPMQYVYTAGKAVINMIAVPIFVVLGLMLSQGVLTALDSITSITSGSVVDLYGEGTEQDDQGNTISAAEQYLQSVGTSTGGETYIFYDIFGFTGAIVYGTADNQGDGWLDSLISGNSEIEKIGAANQTFSGSLFRVAAYNANRVRTSKTTDMSGFLEGQIFSNGAFGNTPENNNQVETAAEMVDTAFANNLRLKDWMWLDMTRQGGWASLQYFTNFLTPGLISFSKFNVGAVWYYYDLWSFNFIVGFGGCIVCVILFINIILGLITRIFMMLGLFLVAPPLFGLAPLDGGNAGKSWRTKFIEQALMAYGAVVGMNLFFIIMPYINQIDFFNIPIADYFVNILVIIVGFAMIKDLISVMSGLIGGKDANSTGKDVKEEVGKTIGTAVKLTAGVAMAGAGVMGASPVGLGMKALGSKIASSKAVQAVGRGLGTAKSAVHGFVKGGFKGAKSELALNRAQNETKKAEDTLAQANKEDFIDSLEGQKLSGNKIREKAEEAGFSKKQSLNLARAFASDKSKKKGGKLDLNATGTVKSKELKEKYANRLFDGKGGEKIKFKNGNSDYASGDEQFSRYYANGNIEKDKRRKDAETALKSAQANVEAAEKTHKNRMANPGVVTSSIGGMFTSLNKGMRESFGRFFNPLGSDIAKASGISFKNNEKKGNKEEKEGNSDKDHGQSFQDATIEQTNIIGSKLDTLNKSLNELANSLRDKDK